jgi:hypothetical protein
MSEKGLLQVLFDLHFVADVLSGGRDVSFITIEFENNDKKHDRYLTSPTNYRRKPTQSEASEASWRKWVASFIQSLSQKLDPIDWAI